MESVFHSADSAVILASGDYPTKPYPLSLLHQARTLVCTDDAVEHLTQREPTWIIGDLDSIHDKWRQQYAHLIVHDPNQENNDLSKAVAFCINKGIRSITILGATGKREDHTLGNISLLALYATQLDHVRMVSDYGTFLALTQSPIEIPCVIGQQVSFFALNPQLRLSAQNVKYPVENVYFDSWWKATLNECTADSLSLSFTHGPLLVYLSHIADLIP